LIQIMAPTSSDAAMNKALKESSDQFWLKVDESQLNRQRRAIQDRAKEITDFDAARRWEESTFAARCRARAESNKRIRTELDARVDERSCATVDHTTRFHSR
jgi:hypothetical protein